MGGGGGGEGGAAGQGAGACTVLRVDPPRYILLKSKHIINNIKYLAGVITLGQRSTLKSKTHTSRFKDSHHTVSVYIVTIFCGQDNVEK